MVKPVASGIRVAHALLLGIPGIAVLAYFGTELVIAIGAQSNHVPALLAFLGGAVLVLTGFGRLRQPLYAVCFLPLPFFLIWTIKLDQTGSWIAWLTHPAIVIWPVVTYRWCKGYYGRHVTLDVTE